MKTSSGYYAGLQSGKDFKVVEQNLKRKHVRTDAPRLEDEKYTFLCCCFV